MLKMKSVIGPILDAMGSFSQTFGEFGAIASDVPSVALSGNAASGQANISVTSTTGFAVGQTILIKDSAGSETATIITVTPAGPTLVVSANLANTYNTARNATVTVTVGVTLPLTANANSG
jgi:hypothetical protein